MSKNVFANGKEVSGKKDDNKSRASMPDVCLSPPSPPAGPIPIPYPNTAVASDTSDGSKTVKIGGAEVGLKNSSNYKKSTGDEAATKGLGMGVVSHNIQGKLKHAAWSMDVKIEGKNVIRHMDMVTQNHMNSTNAVPGIDVARPEKPGDDPLCQKLQMQSEEDVKNDTKTGKLKPGVMSRADVCGSSVKAASPMEANIKGSPSTRAGYLKPKPMVDQVWERREIEQTVKTKDGPVKKKVTKNVRAKVGKEPTIACSSKQYRPEEGSAGGSAHTEGKIIEKAWSEGCKSITLRTQWHDVDKKTKQSRLRNDPCPLCKYSICVAAQECGMDIQECVEDEKGNLTKRPACPEQQG